jgi:hypothetical protein
MGFSLRGGRAAPAISAIGAVFARDLDRKGIGSIVREAEIINLLMCQLLDRKPKMEGAVVNGARPDKSVHCEARFSRADLAALRLKMRQPRNAGVA